MKKVKYIFGIVITLAIVLISLSETISQSNNMKDRFFIGPMNFYFLEVLRTQNHRDWYSLLSYNSMQNYCGHFDSLPANWGTQKDGGYFEDTSSYAGYIRGVIKQWHDSAQINSLILEREKILRAAYGQRSTYQAEDVGNWVGKFPAYGYDTSDFKYNHDITDYWMGESVISKFCQTGIDNAGFMVKGLVDNCEQTNDTSIIKGTDNSSGRRLFSDIKQWNYSNRWYIKPRMRIDSIYAKANPDTAVVMVYIKNFRGYIIDSTLITCNNFLIRDGQGNRYYNGRYLENYYNLTDSSLSVMAYKLAEGFNGVYNSKVDYQVKWLGKVDVWLDYVRVDDSWANSLFTETYESEGLLSNHNPWKFHRAIKDEVTAFKDMPGLAYFWVDECNYNNIPCIAEVNRLVKEYSGESTSLTFIADPQAFVGNGGLRNKGDDWSTHWQSIYDTLFRMGAISNQVICQFFPQQYYVLYPHTLTHNPNAGVEHYTHKDNYEKYYGDIENTNWDGYMTYLNRNAKLMRFVSGRAKTEHLPFGAIVQLNSDEGSIPGWGLREPTNEEISVTNFLAMCYGAKQLYQFSYTSSYQKTDHYGSYYNRGLTTADEYYSGKRDTNYYGQFKWDYVESLNKRMMKIGRNNSKQKRIFGIS